MTVIWRPRAEHDLDGLVAYTAQFNVRAALDLDLRIDYVISLLEANPHLGHLTSNGKAWFTRVENIPEVFEKRPRLDFDSALTFNDLLKNLNDN